MQIEKPEKKNISYDDILSSLNMTIVNGKLQIKRADSQALAQETQIKMEKQKQIHKQQQMNPLPSKPLTREEYRAQLARQYLQKQSDIIKLQESKSKKLMFSNAEISVSPLTMNQNTNHFFKFIGSK
jgi:small-conductance mechanosensitive channel